eukprot:gene10643-10714_t
MSNQNIGFVGVGKMGTPMATRLLKAGYSVTVFDVDQAAVQELVAAGAIAVANAKAVADHADIVFASLPSPQILEKVVLGADGLIEGAKMRIFIDISTTGPRTAAKVAASLAEHGLAMIDAPVSGGLKGARNGTLAIMVSGPLGIFETVRPVLENFGKIFFMGEVPGAAQTMKLANNLLAAAAIAISSEAIVMGVKAGLDPKVMLDVINASSGRNSATEDKFPKSVLPRTFDFGFATGLSFKDVRLCVDEAEAMGVPMVVGSAVRQLLSVTNQLYGPESDFTCMIRQNKMENNDLYEVYAVRYGHHPRRSGENFLGGDPHDTHMPLDYFVWAIVGKKRSFILDTGFDRPMAAKRGRQILRPVEEGLAAIGIDHAKVTDVIISHMHYDHCGNHALFPNATFHLQDAEMEYATGRCMCHQMMRHPFDVDDVTTMVKRLYNGRLYFHEAESQLAPGVTVHKVGGHSRGLQVVRVQTASGAVVLGSDAAHLYANMERERPFPVFDRLSDVVFGVERMKQLASSTGHIIPGHDPLVLKRFARARSDIADIVRLDKPL